MVKKIVGLSLVAVVLVGVAVGTVCRWRHQCRDLAASSGVGAVLQTRAEHPAQSVSTNRLARSPRGGKIYWGLGSTNGVPYDCAYRVQTPKRIPITSEQSNEVAKVFASILDSYQSQDIEGMKTAMKNVPGIVTNMQGKAFIQLSRPLSVALDEHFLWCQSPMEYSDVDGLSAYLRSNLELTLFLGNVALEREDFGTMVDMYDALVLSRLLSYKKLYSEQGFGELEKCVDGFIEEWHRQIESENGFTRQCMWFQVDLQWPNYNEGRWSAAQLSQFVKKFAGKLVSLGYTPKWLSEFDDLSEAVK